MHMNGTSFSATAPMRLMPPISTKPVSAASTTPVIQCDTPKLAFITSAIEFDCTMLPMPKPAMPPKIAKAAPSQRQCGPRPFLMANIGPPMFSPLSSTSR